MPSTNKQDKPTEKSLLRFRLPMKRYHLIRVTLLFLALPLFPQTRDVTKERILFLAEMFKMKGTEKVKTGKAVGIYLAETFAYGGGNDRPIVAEYLSYKAGDIAFKDNFMDSPYIKNVDLEFKVSRDQTSITTLGTIGTGTWQGTVVGPTYGGTGVNNGSKTITLGGSFTHTGAHTLGLTTTANTSVTLPTTGTLATLAGTETFTNKTLTSPTITGGSIDNTSIGASTRSTGAFTTLTSNGATTFTSSTASSSSSTGAVVVTGGVGIGGNLYGAGAGTSTLDGFNIDGGTY